MIGLKLDGTMKWTSTRNAPSQKRSCDSHRSRKAGTLHQYVSRKGAAARIEARTAGRYTMCAPTMVCVSQVNRPWNRASLRVATTTLEMESSRAWMMRGPHELLMVMPVGAYRSWLLCSR